jgi:hypothetical protein
MDYCLEWVLGDKAALVRAQVEALRFVLPFSGGMVRRLGG